MRAFVILCLVAMACADQLGYDYQPVGHSDHGLSFSPGAAEHHDHGDAVLSQEIAPAAAPVQVSAPVAAPAATEYQKEFYTYSAPEGEFEDGGSQNALNSLKKSLRVVFIKAPENKGIENAALSLASQSSHDRTAIYVLARQPDVGSLAQQLQNIKSQSSSRPEVHFVKYRTPQDAASAKQAIQAQYNTLPGVSRSTNEGTAPVLNFASRSPVQSSPLPAAPSSQYLPSNPLPSQQYLPPGLRKYRV